MSVAFPFESLITLGGWILGAIIVVVGMRSQVQELTRAIADLRQDLRLIIDKQDKHERRISWLEGLLRHGHEGDK